MISSSKVTFFIIWVALVGIQFGYCASVNLTAFNDVSVGSQSGTTNFYGKTYLNFGSDGTHNRYALMTFNFTSVTSNSLNCISNVLLYTSYLSEYASTDYNDPASGGAFIFNFVNPSTYTASTVTYNNLGVTILSSQSLTFFDASPPYQSTDRIVNLTLQNVVNALSADGNFVLKT